MFHVKHGPGSSVCWRKQCEAMSPYEAVASPAFDVSLRMFHVKHPRLLTATPTLSLVCWRPRGELKSDEN